MNVLMFTNTFVPHVGGVRRSVDTLVGGLKARGHNVLTVAPSFEGYESDTDDVIRVPALHNVSSTGYSLPLPFAGWLGDRIRAFRPHIIHSHHPFFLGATALRAAAVEVVPIVYTYHTRYEFYATPAGRDAKALRRSLRSLSTGYCNLCDAVIAPSDSIARILAADNVTVPVRVIPTGIDLATFRAGNGAQFRQAASLPASGFVVGHVGRISEEKNLLFLADALAGFLVREPEARVVIAGSGDKLADLRGRFADAGVSDRVHFAGVLTSQSLADLYSALDVFAFASLSETQGLVLQEAMATGCPVVALDAPGARDVVTDRVTGRLLPATSTAEQFTQALCTLAELPPGALGPMRQACRDRSAHYDAGHMVDSVIGLYETVVEACRARAGSEDSEWDRALHWLSKEQRILSTLFHALGDAVTSEKPLHAGT